jgi:tetratricopeptide (TPR) repeat protein
LYNRGEVEGAIRHYEEALRLDASLVACQTGLASARLWQGQLDEAEKHARAALDLGGRQAEAWYIVGVVCALRGEGAEAVTDFRKALGIWPETGRYAYALALALGDQGESVAALSWYRWSNLRHADWLWTANDTAWTLATRPDPGSRNGPLAVWLARQACEATAQQNADYLDTLAAAYAEAGRFDEARATAERAQALLTAQGQLAEARLAEARLERYQKQEPFRTTAGAAQKWEPPPG